MLLLPARCIVKTHLHSQRGFNEKGNIDCTTKSCTEEIADLVVPCSYHANPAKSHHGQAFLYSRFMLNFSDLSSVQVIIEPYDDRLPSVPDPVVQLACLDASLAMKPVFDKYQVRHPSSHLSNAFLHAPSLPVAVRKHASLPTSGPHICPKVRSAAFVDITSICVAVVVGFVVQTVVITSGTLSPIDLYPRILDFNPVSIASLNMTLTRECLCPVVLTRGADQMPVSTKYEMRKDEHVLRCAAAGRPSLCTLCLHL